MGLEDDITWPIITNTSRAWLSISLPLSFSVFWKLGSAPTLVSEARGLFSGRGYSSSMIVFVCAAGGKERAALVSKSSTLQGLHKASTLLFSLLLFSPRRSFTNRVPLALWPPVVIIHIACFWKSCPKTGQAVQARDGSIHLFDYREWIQSNFNWQVERIPETSPLSPKYTRSKSKKGQQWAESRCSTPKPWLSRAASGHNENCSAECAQWRSDRSTRCSAAQWGCYTHDKHVSLPRRRAQRKLLTPTKYSSHYITQRPITISWE